MQFELLKMQQIFTFYLNNALISIMVKLDRTICNQNIWLRLKRLHTQLAKFHYIQFKICKKLQAGITTGYQEKPCLNPFDPDCPSTAPNKEQKMVKFLEWPKKDFQSF